MPLLLPFMKKLIGFNINDLKPAQTKIQCHKSIIHEEFMNDIRSKELMIFVNY